MLTLRQRLEQHQAAYMRLKASLVLLEHESRAVLACHQRRSLQKDWGEEGVKHRDTADQDAQKSLPHARAPLPSQTSGHEEASTRASRRLMAMEGVQARSNEEQLQQLDLMHPSPTTPGLSSPLACRLVEAKLQLERSKLEGRRMGGGEQQGRSRPAAATGTVTPRERLRERVGQGRGRDMGVSRRGV